jgi:hypothetical protein
MSALPSTSAQMPSQKAVPFHISRTMAARSAVAAAATESPKLWSDRPATNWHEAFPLGNGRLGAMVFGGVELERLQLNEESVWSGSPQDAENPDSIKYLPEIRRLLFAGKYAEAQARFEQHKTQVEEARKAADQANQPAKTPAQRIPDLRNAHEKYSDAHQLSPNHSEAQKGEAETKDRLAEALKQEGLRNVQHPLSLKSSRREPRLPEVDASKLEQGISQLEESQQLRPGDPQVDEALKKAKDRLADAKVKQAETFLALEEQIPITKEKLALLRMAREQIDHALEQSPQHQEAQRTGEEIDRRMAQVHEDEGDFQEQQAAFSQPEQQAMQLSQALDHFQQASELRPNQPQLQAKQEKAQQKLAQTLDKLADKLMQSPAGQEPTEAKAARLEGAEQALNELQAIQPSDRTSQRAEQVGKELDGLRQMLADKSKEPSESPGQGDPKNGAQPIPAPPQWMTPPLDGPPRINQPGNKGQAPKSAGRNIRDY